MYFAYGKSYKHDFMKKHDGHKLCAILRFVCLFVHRLEIQNTTPSNVLAQGKSCVL
ncbi:hypothetical protein B296_00000506 [Ensete ventricosum]|uniref:Uncharacterized protein n=1 Tax=Ensete ventricosum TaxID=4639 RepID=A0A427B9K3_ENSVE|nr:hypothetical protein B296_00000506 [Ensete ventricosum]